MSGHHLALHLLHQHLGMADHVGGLVLPVRLLNLRIDAIKVNGNEAEAKGRREDVVVTSNGETVRTPGEFRFRFKRANNRWTIDAVR